MKSRQLLGSLGGILLITGVIATAASNPTPKQYEDYATQRISEYLKGSVCPQLPNLLDGVLRRECLSLVDVSRSQFRLLISRSSDREDYILFSIYRTDLSMGSFFPSYSFESVGVWGHFYTYRAQRQ